MQSDPHQERRDAAAPYVQTFAHLGQRRRRRSRALPMFVLVVVAAIPVAMLAPGHFPAVIDLAGRFTSSILGGVPAFDPPAPAADTLPRIASEAATEAEDVSTDAPALHATDAERAPAEGPTVAEATPPPVEPDQESQVAAAAEAQAAPMGPPAPPTVGARPVNVGGDRPVRARTAEESTIHAIRQLLERDATERAPGEHVGRVEVRLLSIREDGDRSIVRFTRRERCRDTLGRLLERETPPMETVIVKTTEGVRLETPPA